MRPPASNTFNPQHQEHVCHVYVYCKNDHTSRFYLALLLLKHFNPFLQRYLYVHHGQVLSNITLLQRAVSVVRET